MASGEIPDNAGRRIEPYDFSGMSADEIISVHREVFGLYGIMPDSDNPLVDAFGYGFDRLCIERPAEAAEVLARLSLSEDDEERFTSVQFLDALAVGNVAAAIAMFEDALGGRELDIDGFTTAIETLDTAYEDGSLSFDQVTYLLGVYVNNPFRSFK